MIFKIPYETPEKRNFFLELKVGENNLLKYFKPNEKPPLADLKEAFIKAIESPIDSPKLSEILYGAKNVTIITENQFRQAPIKEILPVLIDKIKSFGAEISIIIGCGKVPPLSKTEIANKLGKDVVNADVEICCNDVNHVENYVLKGITTAGTPLWVHHKVTEADVVITIGTVQATLWGYGGSGMIIPAVASNETIEINHIMSLAPDCIPGNNNCMMQIDKYESARLVGIDMGINMIVNNRFEVTYINAGNFINAHKDAIKIYNEVYKFNVRDSLNNKADIVICGSTAPTDHLFFHTGWVNVNCRPIVKKGGTIIFTSPCPGYENWKGFALMDLMGEFMPPSQKNLEMALKAFYNREKELWAGCIWFPIYREMLDVDYWLVTLKENIDMAKSIGFTVFADLSDAYSKALNKHGPNAKVAIVPYGRYTIFDIEGMK